MNRLIIFYPELFNAFSKFERKLLRIASNIDGLEIVYFNDPNNFISRVVASAWPDMKFFKINDWGGLNITHAIFFDDGEEFLKERALVKEMSIPFRVVQVAITRVVNIKKEPGYQGVKSSDSYEYIGRGSYWGNPYSMYEEGDDRDEVVRKYKYDFDYDKFPNKERSEVYKLLGKRLGCFCKPASCHGDVLADYLNSWDDGK